MCLSLSYDAALTHIEIAPLSVPHSNICATLFNEMLSDSDHQLSFEHYLSPSHQACKYSLRPTRKFDVLKINMKHARNSFIIRSSFNIRAVQLVNSFSTVTVLYYIAPLVVMYCFSIKSIYLSSICLSVYHLSVCLPVCLAIYLSVYHLSVCLSTLLQDTSRHSCN